VGILAHARKALMTSMGFRRSIQWALNLVYVLAHAMKALLTSMSFRRSLQWALNLAGIFAHAIKTAESPAPQPSSQEHFEARPPKGTC
jgi:tRNA pseudouridine-54 N-methylase